MDYEKLEAELLEQIDGEAREFVRAYVPDIPGQERAYRQKAKEARSWGGLNRLWTDYPFLRAEAWAKGEKVSDVAEAIEKKADEWDRVHPRAEALRVAARSRVLSASSVGDKRAAAQVDWDSAR